MAEASLPFYVVVQGINGKEVAYPFTATGAVDARISELPPATPDQSYAWARSRRGSDPNRAYRLYIAGNAICTRTELPSLAVAQDGDNDTYRQLYVADGGAIHFDPRFSLPYRREGVAARILRAEQVGGNIERIPIPTPQLYIEGQEEPVDLSEEFVDVYLRKTIKVKANDVCGEIGNVIYYYDNETGEYVCAGSVQFNFEEGLIFSPEDNTLQEVTIPTEKLPAFSKLAIPVFVRVGEEYGQGELRPGTIYWNNPQH